MIQQIAALNLTDTLNTDAIYVAVRAEPVRSEVLLAISLESAADVEICLSAADCEQLIDALGRALRVAMRS